MRLRSRVSGLVLSALLLIADARAQVDVSSWPQVRVEVLAVDPDGTAVQGLRAEALRVRGLGKPRAALALEQVGGPQSVCVLVDASNVDRLSLTKSKVHKLLNNLPAEDEVCIAAFSSDLSLVQPFTRDRRAAIGSVDGIRPQGGTQLRDGLLKLAQFMRGASSNPSRALILFSDGVDSRSNAGQAQFKAGMEVPGSPVVHFVCLPQEFGSARRKQVDPKQGTAFNITDMTGGMTYFPHTMSDMNGLVEALPDALRTRYVLTYMAENGARDGHEERLKVDFNKGYRDNQIRVLAPEGYYAPSQ